MSKKPESKTAVSNSMSNGNFSPVIASAAVSQGPNLKLVQACMATAVELEKTRVLVDSLDAENDALRGRLETEKRTTALLAELNKTRISESEALHSAIAAKNETIAAKDKVIFSQDKLVEALKGKTPSPWRRLGDILTGAAVALILK